MAMTVSQSVLAADHLFEQAKAFVIERHYVSISMLQRKFKLGFSSATKLTQQLEDAGIIAPLDKDNRRLSLIVTEAQQQWWDDLPIIWKKIFTSHIYHGDKFFTPAKQFCGQTAEIALRQPTDLIKVFCLEEIEFYKERGVIMMIPNLADFHYLQSINIRNQQIQEISGLAHCTGLRRIAMYGNLIRDITPIQGLPNLHYVSFNKNPIQDTEGLARLIKKAAENEKTFLEQQKWTEEINALNK